MNDSTKKKGLITTDDFNELESKIVQKHEKVLPVVPLSEKIEVQPNDKFTPERIRKKEGINDKKRRKKENNPLYCMDTNIDPIYLKNADMKTANLLGPLLKIAKTFAIEKETTMIDICNVALYKYLLSEKAIKI